MSRLFRDYGMTEEEAINALSDAINILDRCKDDEQGIKGITAERLADLIVILKNEWDIKD